MGRDPTSATSEPEQHVQMPQGVPITIAGTIGYVLAGIPHQAALPPLSTTISTRSKDVARIPRLAR